MYDFMLGQVPESCWILHEYSGLSSGATFPHVRRAFGGMLVSYFLVAAPKLSSPIGTHGRRIVSAVKPFGGASMRISMSSSASRSFVALVSIWS